MNIEKIEFVLSFLLLLGLLQVGSGRIASYLILIRDFYRDCETRTYVSPLLTNDALVTCLDKDDNSEEGVDVVSDFVDEISLSGLTGFEEGCSRRKGRPRYHLNLLAREVLLLGQTDLLLGGNWRRW